MRIILDTGVLWRPDAIALVSGERVDVILPAVAYAERQRQLVQQGKTTDFLDKMLRTNDIDVEPFTREEANRVSPTVSDDFWESLARDAMIAGHVGVEDVLWTTNSKDFLELGLLNHQILVVP